MYYILIPPKKIFLNACTKINENLLVKNTTKIVKSSKKENSHDVSFLILNLTKLILLNKD